MSGSPDSKGKPNIDFEELKKYFNEKMEGQLIGKIVSLSDRRKTTLRARAREYGADAVRRVIDKAAGSDFMNGKNERNWVANFDWIFKPTNFEKILNGNYDNSATVSTKRATGYDVGVVLHQGEMNYNDNEW